MIKNFFLGLGTGLRGDLVVWLLLVLIALTGWVAYGLWFKTTSEEINRSIAEFRQLYDEAKREAQNTGR